MSRRFMSTNTSSNDMNYTYRRVEHHSNQRLRRKDKVEVTKLFIRQVKSDIAKLRSNMAKEHFKNFNKKMTDKRLNDVKLSLDDINIAWKKTGIQFNKYKFIPTTKTKPYNESRDPLRLFVAADFETIVHENKHFPFTGSISNHKTTRNAYIDTHKLKEDLSNLESLSNDFLLLFWDKLKAMLNKYPKKTKKQIYFHNMNKFDGIFILKLVGLLLDSNKIKSTDTSLIHRNYVLYEIIIEDMSFRDSIQLLPGSLNNLAKTFDVGNKPNIDIKFTYHSLFNKHEEIINYCNNDARMLRDILNKFKIGIVDEYNFNPLHSITTSSLAFSILKRYYIPANEIENTTNASNLHNFIENSYRGGLSSVFKPICDNYKLTLIDINSSYPFSMTKDLPTGRGMIIHKEDINEINDKIDEINGNNKLDLFGFFDITLEVNSRSNISPLVIKYDGRLTDANGEIRITVFSEELNFILSNGGKLMKIHAGVLYDRSPYLNDFANELYTKRKTATTKTGNLLYKLILNSSYGRFALRQNNETMYIASEEDMKEVSRHAEISGESNIGIKHKIFNLHSFPDDTTRVDIENKIAEKMINSPKRFKPHRAIQVASAITAYSRIELMKQALKILDTGYEVYYMDTDSIYTDMPRDDIMELGNISDKLGDWDIEKEKLRAIFIQPKFYLTESEDSDVSIKLKGIPGFAIDDIKPKA